MAKDNFSKQEIICALDNFRRRLNLMKTDEFEAFLSGEEFKVSSYLQEPGEETKLLLIRVLQDTIKELNTMDPETLTKEIQKRTIRFRGYCPNPVNLVIEIE